MNTAGGGNLAYFQDKVTLEHAYLNRGAGISSEALTNKSNPKPIGNSTWNNLANTSKAFKISFLGDGTNCDSILSIMSFTLSLSNITCVSCLFNTFN